MSWRHDPLSGRTVRVAPRRAERPSDFAADHPTRRCPFCAGAESDTPPEVDRIDDGAGGWLARVVPNQYPAVEGADGAQEVVVESPRHATRFIDLTAEEAAAAVTAWARRLTHWQSEGRFDYTLLFKNEGPAAGASLQHTHSQVAALPTAPASVESLWRAVRTAPSAPDAHPIWSDGAWSVVAAAAPRFPYETRLQPSPHGPTVADLAAGAGSRELAGLLANVIAAIADATGQGAYNLVLQIPPASMPDLAGRWWIEIVPRPSQLAGFELATGLWISATSPEVSARMLAGRLAYLADGPADPAA